jgi:hypothetical protein
MDPLTEMAGTHILVQSSIEIKGGGKEINVSTDRADLEDVVDGVVEEGLVGADLEEGLDGADLEDSSSVRIMEKSSVRTMENSKAAAAETAPCRRARRLDTDAPLLRQLLGERGGRKKRKKWRDKDKDGRVPIGEKEESRLGCQNI